MATRTKKPKCNGKTSQSCGMGCISREHTCKEILAADVATRLLAVAKQHQQPNDASGQSFDTVAANFPASVLKAAHKTGVATSDLGNGATLTTKVAVGLDGSTIKYGFVTDADGVRYTVSDGLVKEVTSAAGSEWQEAFDAAVRSKVAVAVDLAAPSLVTESMSIASKAVVLDLDLDMVMLDNYIKTSDKKFSAKAKAIAMLVGSPPGGAGLSAWLTSAYENLSEYTYKSEEDIKASGKYSIETAALVMSAAKALAKLPSATAEQLNSKNIGSNPLATEARMQALNRFAFIGEELVAKYKEGSTVTEHGMFGTSYLTEKEFSTFAYADSTHFVVKSKGFGATAGKAVDQFKNETFEGEVLFTPGTKFKVAKVSERIRILAYTKDTNAKFDHATLVSEINRSDPDAVVGDTTFGKLQSAIKQNDTIFLKAFDKKLKSDATFSFDTVETIFAALKPIAKREIRVGEALSSSLYEPGTGEETTKVVKSLLPHRAADIDAMLKLGPLAPKELAAEIANRKLGDIFDTDFKGKITLANQLVSLLHKSGRRKIYLEEL